MRPIPYPPRFSTMQDALEYVESSDVSLCIPPLVKIDTPEGKKIVVNPEYKDASFEYSVIWDGKPVRLF